MADKEAKVTVFVQILPPSPCRACHRLNEAEGWTVEYTEQHILEKGGSEYPAAKTIKSLSKLAAEMLLAHAILNGATVGNAWGQYGRSDAR